MEILAHCKKFKILIQSCWIPTKQMALDGVDDLSRQDYSRLVRPLTLSDQGVQFILENFGAPSANLFASFDQNVFGTAYCSHHAHEDDPLFLGCDGLTFLTERQLSGVIFILPPTSLVEPVVKILQFLSIDDSTTLLLIVPSFVASTVRQNLNSVFEIKQQKFSSGRKKGLLSKKTFHAYILFTLRSKA